MIKLDNYIKYLFYFFAMIIGAIIYIIYHTARESHEGIDNSKIILGESNGIDIQKYKEAYCDTEGNGLFISMNLNIDNSGSIVRKGHYYLFNPQGGWGYIWDPERNNNILECGYKYDIGTSGCFNEENQPDKCDCNDGWHGFNEGDFCMISDDPNSTCIKDFLNSDSAEYKDEYNEFIYLKNLPGKTVLKRFKNIPAEKRPDALINLVNYNTNPDLNIFHEDTNILLANYDIEEKELYLYDITTVKNYKEYIKTHRYYNESEMRKYNNETENSIEFLEKAKEYLKCGAFIKEKPLNCPNTNCFNTKEDVWACNINDKDCNDVTSPYQKCKNENDYIDVNDDTDDNYKCINKFNKVLNPYDYSIFRVFKVFGINSFNEYIDVDNEEDFYYNLIDFCNKKVNNLSVPINYIDDIINNIKINKTNLNEYVNKTRENINCE